ncbi:MAG TPA: DUF362 domain-containing protein [Blastocatellia bacterium]|nr:DUF362 domain-containing protein [Blastocatellia bacterium]
MSRARVVVIKTKPNTVIDDYRKLLNLANVDQHLDPAATTILKDNISWHFPYPGANTTPWQLEGTILGLQDGGLRDLVCVQNNTVVTDPYKGERLNKYLPVFKKHDIPIRYNCDPTDLKWVKYEPKGKMLVLHDIYPEGITIPKFFLGKNIVHLPTVKCHIYTTTTGAMKNAFGGLLNTKRHYTHSVIHETLVDLLTIQKEIHKGLFAVMDGTTCGNGPGPRTMIPVEKDLILASDDQVAIDAVAAKIMGFDPMSIKYIRLAHEAGLGVGRVEEIEIVGHDIEREIEKFHVGDNFASRIGDVMWFGPLRGLQKLFFHTPLVYAFVFGSSFYHDYAWYPTKGKKVVEQHRLNSKWGKLFDTYDSI